MAKSKIEKAELSSMGAQTELLQANKVLNSAKAIEQKAEAAKKEINEDKPKLIPLFIGTELTDVIGLTEAILTDKFPDHIVVCLSPKMYADLAYRYEFQNKSDEQQKAHLTAQKDEQMKLNAFDVAGKIETVLNLPKYFTIQQLRQAYNAKGQNVSHKQVDEIVNFLGMYGYLRQIDVDVPSHKMRYQIILTNQDIRKQIEIKNSAIKIKIAQLNSELEGNEGELTELNESENADIAFKGKDLTNSDSKPAKSKSAAPKRKKVADESNTVTK